MKAGSIATVIIVGCVIILGPAIGSAELIDEILFGTAAGREVGDAPPGPYTSEHQLINYTAGALADFIYMDGAGHYLDWIFDVPAGGGTVTITTEFYKTFDSLIYGPSMKIYTSDPSEVGSAPYTGLVIEYKPAHSEYKDTATVNVTFDNPSIGVRRAWGPTGNPQVGFYNSRIEFVSGMPYENIDMIDFGNGTRFGQLASMLAHNASPAPTDPNGPGITFDSLNVANQDGKRSIYWDFTVPVAGYYRVQVRVEDDETSTAWGVAHFSLDLEGDGHEGDDYLAITDIDTTPGVWIKTYEDIYIATPGTYQGHLFCGSSVARCHGAQIFMVVPQTCQEARDMGHTLEYDFNNDCHIDLLDFSYFVPEWLDCMDPDDEDCAEPWFD